MTAAPRHVNTLDSMRALSALAVFLSHLVQIAWLPVLGLGSWLHRANSLLSESAVIVFFLLSGYLITMSIWRNIERSGRFDFLDFAAARIARIYPPLLCAILIALAVYYAIRVLDWPGGASPLRHAGDLYAARDMLSMTRGEIKNALMMRSGLLTINGPLWSLYIEVQLYAAAGAFAYLLRGAGLAWRAAAGLLLGLLLWSSIRETPDYLLYAAWWLLGASFFVCQLSPRRNLLLSLVVAGLGAAILYTTHASPLVEATRIALMLILAALMFFVWSWESRLLEEIAGFSYTLYLIHFPIIILVYSGFLALQSAAPPSFAARSVASLAAAVLAYYAARFLGKPAENSRFFKRLILLPFHRASGRPA